MHIRESSIVRRSEEDGASLVEYGLLLALIAVVAYSAVTYFGSNGDGIMTRNGDCIGSAMAGGVGADCT